MEKTTSSANRLVLKRILAQDGNGRCADCKTATHPRWASWNIGILICIRCSGIHRSLGTHISKVRSIDLDTWNDQQLEKLSEIGNTRANAYWEARLPSNYVPDESKIVNFIKTKYELRRWVPADCSVPESTAAPGVPPKVRADPSRSGASAAESGASSVSSLSSNGPTGSASADLLSLDNFNVGSAPPARPIAVQPHQQHGQTYHHASGGHKIQHTVHHLTHPFSYYSPPKNAAQKDRGDVKRSILSLYSQPMQPSPVARPAPSRATSQSNSTTNPQQPIDYDEDNFSSVWK